MKRRLQELETGGERIVQRKCGEMTFLCWEASDYTGLNVWL